MNERGMMMTDFDKELDCSGLNCPMPILKTKKMIDTMNPGEILRMISTDPGSCSDVNAWANRTGNELLSTSEDGGNFIFLLKKKG